MNVNSINITLIVNSQELSKKYPSFSFTHIYPGGVKTSIGDWSYATKALMWLATPLLTSVEVSTSSSRPLQSRQYYDVLTIDLHTQDCSEWMMRPVFDRAMSQGAFHLDNHADPYPTSKLHLGQEPQTALYKHLMETISKK